MQKEGVRSKKGISAVVATVLIILITIAAVTIIWVVILPMIKNNISSTNLNAGVSIDNSNGFTVYDSNTKIACVQVKREADSTGLVGAQIIFSFNGTSYTAILNSTDIPNVNQEKTFCYNLSNYSAPNSIKIAPITLNNGNKVTGTPTSVVANVPAGNVPATTPGVRIVDSPQTGCTADASCNDSNSCTANDKQICSGGVLGICSGTNVAAGDSCSGNKVCDGNGNCIAKCSSNSDCSNTDNPCTTGTCSNQGICDYTSLINKPLRASCGSSPDMICLLPNGINAEIQTATCVNSSLDTSAQGNCAYAAGFQTQCTPVYTGGMNCIFYDTSCKNSGGSNGIQVDTFGSCSTETDQNSCNNGDSNNRIIPGLCQWNVTTSQCNSNPNFDTNCADYNASYCSMYLGYGQHGCDEDGICYSPL